MLKDAFIIFKKEILNILRDRRAVMTNYLLPLILMPLIFVTIGRMNSGKAEEAKETFYPVVIENNVDERFNSILQTNLNYYPGDENTHLKVRFSEDWIPGEKGSVEIFYDSTKSKSSYAASRIEIALEEYEQLLSEDILKSHDLTLEALDTLSIKQVDIAPPESKGSDFLVFMVPYMIMIYLFAGAMAISLDCTAGEKERGSLALILVNQVSRRSIALGKTLFVMVSGFINNLATFTGLIIASSLMGNIMGNGTGIFEVITPGSGFLFLITLISMGGISSSIMVLIGSLAKTMKEGGGYIMPVYIGAIFLAVSTSQMEVSGSFLINFVPLMNGIFIMKSILLGQGAILPVLITVSVNLLVVSIVLFFTSKLYDSERILNT